MESRELLREFIEQDFGIKRSGRYYRSAEHNSLVLDYEAGIFFWNSKDIFGGPFEYLTKIRKLSPQIANKILSKYNLEEIKEYSRNITYENATTYYPLAIRFYENGKNDREYWYRRLLKDSTIDRFLLGKVGEWNTIPSISDGKLLNIQLRTDGEDKKIRQWYRGTGPTRFNFDILNFVSEVIYCEGVVDSILLNQEGLPSISIFGGAGNWKNEWFPFFRKVKTIYLAFDNDDAGRIGAKRISEKIGAYKCRIYTFDTFKEKYDVMDYFRDGNTKKDLVNLLEKESRYAFEIS